MPESSSPSVETISEQDYISKTVAITLLQELLKKVVIDEDVKNTLLEQFSQNLEESFQNPEWVQELSLTFNEVERESPLEEVESVAAYRLYFRLLLCHPHSIHCPPRPPITSSPILQHPGPGSTHTMSSPEWGSTGQMTDHHPLITPPTPPTPNPTPFLTPKPRRGSVNLMPGPLNRSRVPTAPPPHPIHQPPHPIHQPQQPWNSDQ